MSLTSEVFLVREDGGIDILIGEADGRPDGTDLAGPESWRTKVWGSRAIRRIGARFLPALVSVHNGDVVAPDEIPAFLREIALVRANLTRLVAETRTPDRTVEYHSHHISSRLDAIAASARYAQRIGGGLLIW
ncbi:hypothetical protein [Streptomyces aurantiogriseus]|uniref:Uncharacterized protein n=1 Tax=Streptomyces aurantiogriseus TaxID=66870 RepID=A0A918L0I8_9ACTN|nr:hypothetical protein [Streptomyces aurantiogriseus]GGR64696.1 hypothetical protein GCM10010251_96560 [Streptomyces aurantiogriseus]